MLALLLSAWTEPVISLIIAPLFVLWLNLQKSVDCFESLPNRLTRSFSTLYEGYTVQSISSWTSIRLLVCLLVQTVMQQTKKVGELLSHQRMMGEAKSDLCRSKSVCVQLQLDHNVIFGIL
jgi:hypothetical protein